MKRDAAIALATLAGVVVVVVGAIALAGADPATVAARIVERALLTRSGLAEAVTSAIPLCLIALGICVAFRARIFNIGGDGQVIVGAALAVALAPFLPGGPVGICLLLILGALGGGVWGGIAGGLKTRFGANEIVTTIMLNYVAIQLLSWLVRGPLQEAQRIIPRSEAIDPGLMLPVIVPGTRIHLGLVLALVAAAVLAMVMARSRFGFRLAVLGEGPEAGVYAGLDPARTTFLALAVSGAFAGLAGAIEVAGLHGRLQDNFAAGFGISAIAVALVAQLKPQWVPLSAFGFAALYVGLGAVARSDAVPFPIVYIIEGATVLAFLLAGAVVKARRTPIASEAV